MVREGEGELTEDQYREWNLYLKIFTLLAIIIGGLFAIYKFESTKEKEFYSTFWNKKLELYQRTSNAVATMATTSDINEYLIAKSDFLELYYGELSLVESLFVKENMQKFYCDLLQVQGSGLNEPELPVTKLQQPAYKLSLALHTDLAMSWKEPFGELLTRSDTKYINFTPVSFECASILKEGLTNK